MSEPTGIEIAEAEDHPVTEPYFVVLDRQTNNVLGEFDTRAEAETLAAELSDGRLVVEEIPA